MTDAARTGPSGLSSGDGTVRRIAALDWSVTPLGYRSGWPAVLHDALDVCLGARLPMVLLWGPELVLLYNDALVPLLGAKHPALGRPATEVFPEAWQAIGARLRGVLAGGPAVHCEDALLAVARSGYREEAYFTYSFSAVRDATGRPHGVLGAGVETTAHVLGGRRLATLRGLGEVSAVAARSPEQASATALEVLAANRADVPFAMVHLLDEDRRHARMVASYGMGAGVFDWATIPHPAGGATRWRVATTGVAAVTADLRTRYPGGTLPGVGPMGTDASDGAVVLPLTVAGAEQPIGVISLGLSPYRELDADYRGFLDLVARQIGTAVTDARTHAAQRRATETERAARDAAEALAARLRALVDGLAAVVWEIDARTWEVLFVSERIEELLGHPVSRWLGSIEFWRSTVHPDDRDAVVSAARAAVAAGTDYEVTYRAHAADGRTVWVRDLVHVVAGAGGAVERLQGVLVDVTAQVRTREVGTLLTEIGRQVDTGSLAQRLTGLLRLAVPALADLGVISALGPDGMLRPIAAARPGRPSVAEAVLAVRSYPLSPALRPAYAAGRPFVVASPTDAELRALAAGERDYAMRRELGVRSTLIVPLTAGGRMLGTLSMVSTEMSREHDTGDLELAGELGRRAALMVESERLATRERQLMDITTALAAAGTVAEAARVLVAGVRESFDATAVAAYLRDPTLGLRVVHSTGFPELILRHYGVVRADDDQPVGVCARTREPVWLRTDDEWRERFPHLMEHHAVSGNVALMALPMVVGGRVVGALAASFGTQRTFDADEQQFARTVTAHAAQAFERAALADTRREIAETLQHSLLPAALPSIDRLALAARYEPGAHGSQAGGDWYEVLPLGTDRVAIVVGDVVGQGAAAAAVMGQQRSALAAALLDGCGPAAALTRLDLFARRVEGARASTVACTVLDVATGMLRWARAGHPPPLVLDGPAGGGARYLDGAAGTVLGAAGGFTEERTTLVPGSVLMLYTDGLVERRGEVIDDGLQRLRDAAVAAGPVAPDLLIDEVLSRTLHPAGPPDDVAVIAVRLGPQPLQLVLPAHSAQLRRMRRAVAAWTELAGLDARVADDLQLALGEAVANVVEHAYPAGAPGTVEIELRHEAGAAACVRVRDSGVWRPPPADRGFRGRGLDLIHLLGTDAAVTTGPGGTVVEFRVRPSASAGAPITPAGPAPEEGPARLHVSGGHPVRRIALTGELDLAGVSAVRAGLRAALAGAGPACIDLTGLSYLASAGVGLLVEAMDRWPEVSLRMPAGGPVRAVLDLVGLSGTPRS
ncbi:MAG: SpoIIE family protein phosphatase [Pseudonocardia sp.]